MQIDFYQLSRDPVERVVPLLVTKALETGARVVVVDGEVGRREALSQALWAQESAFLAHGGADEPHAERQPILLAGNCEFANGASFAILADGEWREDAARYERALLLFASKQVEPARELWRSLKSSGRDLRFFTQNEQGRWKQAG